MSSRRQAYINSEPSPSTPSTLPKELARAEFARRLNRMMITRGWNQSELARRCDAIAKDEHPDGSVRMGRDKISKYIRGQVLPSPLHLDLICSALKCKPEELVPERGAPEAGDSFPQISTQDAGDGFTWLRVNKMVPTADALEVLTILNRKQ